MRSAKKPSIPAQNASDFRTKTFRLSSRKPENSHLFGRTLSRPPHVLLWACLARLEIAKRLTVACDIKPIAVIHVRTASIHVPLTHIAAHNGLGAKEPDGTRRNEPT